MKFILKFFYFIIFMVLAIAVMFLGGVSGVAGTFYVLVEKGDVEHNLIIVSAALLLTWLVVVLLRGRNKRVLRRKKQERKAAQADQQAQGG